MTEKLLSTLKRPIVAVPSAIASVVTVIDPTWLYVLFETTLANSGTLFAGVSIFASTVVPNVGFLAHLQSAFLGAMVVLAFLHGAKLLSGVYEDYTEEMDDT